MQRCRQGRRCPILLFFGAFASGGRGCGLEVGEVLQGQRRFRYGQGLGKIVPDQFEEVRAVFPGQLQQKQHGVVTQFAGDPSQLPYLGFGLGARQAGFVQEVADQLHLEGPPAALFGHYVAGHDLDGKAFGVFPFHRQPLFQLKAVGVAGQPEVLFRSDFGVEPYAVLEFWGKPGLYFRQQGGRQLPVNPFSVDSGLSQQVSCPAVFLGFLQRRGEVVMDFPQSDQGLLQ